MSRKLSLIPIGVIIVAGAAWASSLLFPDTVTFPRFPGWAGTLSGALSLFDPTTGSARDTQKLWWTGSLWYLKWSVCPNPYEVWRGIDASGNAICGKNLPILSIGTFYEFAPGCVEVLPSGTSTWVAGNGWTTLKSGDIVRTKGLATCEDTTTIKFVADNSILRLDKNTTVELQSGELDGNTVAQAILQNGSLWGRVLTSTGVNIGGGGIIAWVRGTSVRADRFLAWANYAHRISIVHSRLVDSVEIAKTLDGGTVTRATTGDNFIYYPISAWSNDTITFQEAPTDYPDKTASINQWLVYLYGSSSSSLKIKKNTLKDIQYLKSLINTLPIGTARSLVQEELTATIPTAEQDRINLCNTGTPATSGYWYGTGAYGCVLAYADTSTSHDLNWKNGTSKWEALAVKDLTWSTTDWNSFKDGNYIGYDNNNSSATPFWTSNYKYSNLWWWVLAAGTNKPTWYDNSCSSFTWDRRNYCLLILHEFEKTRSPYVEKYQWVWVQKKWGLNYSNNLWNWTWSYGYNMIRLISGYQFWDRWTEGQATYNLNPETLNITQQGQYLTYVGNTSTLQNYLTSWYASTSELYQLTGKTITIELWWPAGSNLPTWWTKAYIADFGDEKWFISNGRNCAGTTTLWRFLCKQWSTESTPYTSWLSISLQLANAPTQFIIGNIYNPSLPTTHLTFPLWTTIQKIIIQ